MPVEVVRLYDDPTLTWMLQVDAERRGSSMQTQPVPTEPRTVRRLAMARYLGGMAAVVGVVAAIGVFGRGDLVTDTVESLRGETFELVTTEPPAGEASTLDTRVAVRYRPG
jgi:hypothetical protein